ncbi:hypothetical protein QLS71_015980 [Mariniflexile litorale]|uniref:Uncharacterized protein n=1 Tax=Mariniflexile litorale TaxID=3045158 RepID=A0AAU7EF66_9FLAO|nr:hypothetical protein [Mariniflexile sp. KMM 9835]MDQ8212356.1 hypothetical protein [Mariniflexile sp. KMM 9835]
MKQITKTTNKWYMSLFFMLMIGYFGFAQDIEVRGPTYVNLNETNAYWIDLDGLDLDDPEIEEVHWEVTGGEIVQIYNNGESILIKWTSTGDQDICYYVDTYINGSYDDCLTVDVN